MFKLNNHSLQFATRSGELKFKPHADCLTSPGYALFALADMLFIPELHTKGTGLKRPGGDGKRV